ncbi:thioredoxin-like protein [Jimgerdemannia flammicorona]|uniref:Thioredoxin-like protein n=1 Tax=Jimgerdemannia flammicorona TaxID=994334 RepID=A0A433QSH6_9FUNG|nr:thioredoxin-like protein [Jimgerdemannia flammicorona]
MLNTSIHCAGVARPALFHTTRVARDGRVLEIKKEEFEEIVVKAKQPVIVDFYAHWCDPCKVLGPILAKSVAENKKVTMARLNVDEAADVASKYK